MRRRELLKELSRSRLPTVCVARWECSIFSICEVFSSGGRFGCFRYEDFVHPLTVHIHDLELVSLQFKCVAGNRDAADLEHDQSAKSLVAARLFPRQFGDFENFFKIVDL